LALSIYIFFVLPVNCLCPPSVHSNSIAPASHPGSPGYNASYITQAEGYKLTTEADRLCRG